MPNTLSGAKKAYQMWLLQTLMLGAIVSVLGIIKKDAASFLLGGSTYLFPQGIFTWLAFRHQGALAANKILYDFYLGELFKIIFTIGLFYLNLRFVHVSSALYFVGYCSMHILQWASVLLINRNTAVKLGSLT